MLIFLLWNYMVWGLGCKSVIVRQSGVTIPYPKVRWIGSRRNWDGARADFALSLIISNVSALRTR